MPANLENSTEATGLEKVSFHPNPKERQWQRKLKLTCYCAHFTCSFTFCVTVEIYFYKADWPGVLPMATVPGTLKERNGRELTEAEDIKRGGKNTQKNCTKKIFMTQIIMMV